ncbi:hypothetical protein [Aquabacterium sp.]|uniref:hypothetical protein n=1 Tax=Aquabacterium sp. TaxID=1872578 RepID=UPI002BB9F982|nr:hypothetical protein [Aquabacterium sp.]HSW06684.1 hypothetical protein [Aquabacterium sp.]
MPASPKPGPAPETLHDDEDPDLSFMDTDAAPAADASPPRKRTDDSLPEDESADPVGDGHSDADLARTLPPVPGRQPDSR